jgi:YHS domain-containing protein
MAISTDPVCKIRVDESKGKIISEFQGKKYFFCAPGCKVAFDRNPEKYLTESKKN